VGFASLAASLVIQQANAVRALRTCMRSMQAQASVRAVRV
jgi:hypothetical protein